MAKTDLILNLVKEGKISVEEAKVLMEKEKEYVYIPQYPYYWNTQPYITYGTGYAVTTNADTFTISTSN